MTTTKESPKPTTANGPKAPAVGVPKPRVPTTPSPTPFEFVKRFAEQMDHLFEDFAPGWRLPTALTRGRELIRREVGLIPAEWSPQIDVLEKDGRFVIRADLPGMSKEDIKVEVIEDTVTIQGERKHERKEEDEGSYYTECSYGSFYRAIPLPEGAEVAKVTAEFRNGVLEVVIPVPPRMKRTAHQVEIKES
jgi:HSP20 family protein